jgi:carbamoyltransferase
VSAVLGISAFYHDAAAALVIRGVIVAAAQEERFTRKKHDASFPKNAVEYCLREGGLRPGDLDYVGFYEKPYRTFDRLLETYLAFAPRGFMSFAKAMPVWLSDKMRIAATIRSALGGQYRKRVIFGAHHESHAASAFFPSPFEEAAILTMDGVGEWATTSFGHGNGNELELTKELRFPHSLGLLYSAFTYFAGFKVNSGEYKLMGLAPYGEPRYVDRILAELVDLKEDGSFRLNLDYFNYCQGLTMTSDRFSELFGGPPRSPESTITTREMDMAASVQRVTEEIMLRCARTVHRETGSRNLCMAGGVALNCVGNGRIFREGPFERIWIQPAAGDSGGALGVALLICHQLLGAARSCEEEDAQHGSLLGPRFDANVIREHLDSVGARYHESPSDEALCCEVADLLSKQNVVGWMQGRMEFGPRALGCRSILGDPRNPEMQATMNLKIKFRESFRPFAPSIKRERVADYFRVPEGTDSPYMLLVAPVQDAVVDEGGDDDACGFDKRERVRTALPATTHVDGSARIQTVDMKRHGRYHQLLSAFEDLTGCPVLINTSFNVRGEPIVCTPKDAYRCFMATHMDVLVIERFVLMKREQPSARAFDQDEYLSEFELD